jgi:hypothetical protein
LSANTDPSKAPGDAAPPTVDTIVRSNAEILKGHALVTGYIAPSLMAFGGIAVAEAVMACTHVFSVPEIATSLTAAGAGTVILAGLQAGLYCGARRAKAAIAAATNGAGEAISHAAQKLAIATGWTATTLGAWDVTHFNFISNHGVGVVLFGAATVAGLAGLVASWMGLNKATNAVIANANG